MRQSEVEQQSVLEWKAIQFIEFELKKKIQCPQCEYKYDSFYCIEKNVDVIRVVTKWKCFNGGCQYEVEYVRSPSEENKNLQLPLGVGNSNGKKCHYS